MMIFSVLAPLAGKKKNIKGIILPKTAQNRTIIPYFGIEHAGVSNSGVQLVFNLLILLG
jgi:hypothetical protein